MYVVPILNPDTLMAASKACGSEQSLCPAVILLLVVFPLVSIFAWYVWRTFRADTRDRIGQHVTKAEVVWEGLRKEIVLAKDKMRAETLSACQSTRSTVTEQLEAGQSACMHEIRRVEKEGLLNHGHLKEEQQDLKAWVKEIKTDLQSELNKIEGKIGALDKKIGALIDQITAYMQGCKR